ncbi:stress response protein nst1 [Drosophila hydei]|uniref:Stress response protein nst1 n=1 Tax=Drosophila hydei TaxID=7224 RepID=A0A6J1LFN0_DROHY|nr:stress response protein nst1 [Drosophila hydei]
MNMVKSLKLYTRMFRQFRVSRMARDIHGSIATTAGCHNQVRHFRSDEPKDWKAKRGDDALKQMNKKYSDDKFADSRYGNQHYSKYDQGEGYDQTDSPYKGNRDPESRRLITQDTIDHQRRQERIIEDNRRRWQKRVEPKSPSQLQYERTSDIFGADKPGKRHQRRPNEDQSAEDYSKRRREHRQKEKQRQERELRESRKGYKLPKAEETSQPASEAIDKEWLARKTEEQEAKYWHSWTTCPNERCNPDAESDESSSGYKKSDRRGFIKPTLPYDSSVRRFQTHSQQLTVKTQIPLRPMQNAVQKHPTKDLANTKRRRPSGMEKQLVLLNDFNRLKMDKTKQPTSLLQSHVFNTPKTKYSDRQVEEKLEDMELPEQLPRTKLAWQGLPRPVYKRFDGVKRAIARKTQGQSKFVEPPRFKMTLRSKSLSRKRTPTDSFSNMLNVNTHFTPHSEYTGYGRQTVCDAWQNFSNVHCLKQVC